jgi:hypothetical protein
MSDYIPAGYDFAQEVIDAEAAGLAAAAAAALDRCSWAVYSSAGSQSLSASVVTKAGFDAIDTQNGIVSFNTGLKRIYPTAGTYTVMAGGCVTIATSAASTGYAQCLIRRNGGNLGWPTSSVSAISTSSSTSEDINVFHKAHSVTISAGQYFEVFWRVSATNLSQILVEGGRDGDSGVSGARNSCWFMGFKE